MRCNFKKSLHGSAAASESVEKDPLKDDVTMPHSTSPHRGLHSSWQHVADYICLFMEEGEKLTLGKDQATPLIVEVALSVLFSSFCFLVHLLYHLCLMFYTIQSPFLGPTGDMLG